MSFHLKSSHFIYKSGALIFLLTKLEGDYVLLLVSETPEGPLGGLVWGVDVQPTLDIKKWDGYCRPIWSACRWLKVERHSN